MVQKRTHGGKLDSDFERIHREFRPVVFRYLQRLAGDRDAEDLTQEVFMKISRGLRDFRNDSQLSTWIYRIATNAALDRLRSPDFIQPERQEAIGDDKDIWPDEKAAPADQLLIRREMNECIRGVIEKLPADYRTVIVLSDLEEMKNSRIAEILGISLDAVKIRLHRARVKLKEALDAQCDFYRDERNELACDRKPTALPFRKNLG